MADLETSPSPCNVYLRQSAGSDTAQDWRLRYQPATDSFLHIQSYNGGAGVYQDAVIISQLGALHVLGGIAAGSNAGSQVFKVEILTGTLGNTGADNIGLSYANKTLAVIGSVFDQQINRWSCYDFNAASGGGSSYYVTFTRAGGGDTLTITYGGNMYNQSYVMCVLRAL
jgi:hypothetical protein